MEEAFRDGFEPTTGDSDQSSPVLGILFLFLPLVL
jgi:hypothetical protein